MEIVAVLIMILVLVGLAGPVAFIVAIVCLNRISRVEDRLNAMLRSRSAVLNEPTVVTTPPKPAIIETAAPLEMSMPTSPMSPSKSEELPKTSHQVEDIAQKYRLGEQPQTTAKPEELASPGKPPFAEVSNMAAIMEKCYGMKSAAQPAGVTEEKSAGSLEQVIGTRVILVAGIISVIVGVGFFLKYAYENMWLGPWARVCVAAGGGLAALIIGEVTRRRGYDVVARGVTALGFAILYTAAFSAYRVYHLIDALPAFAAAIVVTAAAMVYAVALNEVLAAFLALLGGFLTPVLLSTGKNTPHILFGYVLVLSCGAMGCALFRRWRAVNVMAFIGTYWLYTGWFEKFLRPILPYVDAHRNIIFAAEAWLGIFFILYLILPLMYGFVKRQQAHDEDVVLAPLAGVISFYYLWTMLEKFFRTELAILTAVMGLIYLAIAGWSLVRCKEDKNLRVVLTLTGLGFITAALPLYFKTNALVISWTIEAATLLAAGVIYRSIAVQTMGMLATVLSLGALGWIPSHEENFKPVLNAWFGTWMFAALGVFVSHLFYRRRKEIGANRLWSEILFLVSAAVVMTASAMEWQAYCRMAFSGQEAVFGKGLLCILTGFGILLTAVGLFYASLLIRAAAILTVAASVIGLFEIFSHTGIYRPMWNTTFGTWLLVGAGVGINHLLYRSWKRPSSDEKEYGVLSEFLFVMMSAVIAGACCLEWNRYWNYQSELVSAVKDSLVLRGMLVSAAVFMVAQVLRPVSPGGKLCRLAAAIVGGLAGVIAINWVEGLYCREFRCVVNIIFAAQAAPALAMFVAAILLRKEQQACGIDPIWYRGFALAGVVLLWWVLSQQVYLYWQCRDQFGGSVADWRFKANLSLSLLWAGYGAVLLIVGFWKQVASLRYLALALFGLLLAKVFIIDMATVKSIYRIAAFLATGLLLVGVSYLYQFLKKKGFFEAILAAQDKKE